MKAQYQSQQQRNHTFQNKDQQPSQKKSYDWKKYIKRVSQIGLCLCAIAYIGQAMLFHEVDIQPILQNQSAEHYVQTKDRITEGDGILDAQLTNEIMVDGDYYTLPCTLKYFTDNGWEIDEYSDDVKKKISGYETGYVYLKKGNREISVTVEAPYNETVRIGDGYVTGIYTTYSQLFEESAVEFKISGGLYSGMTKNELETILKENEWEYRIDTTSDYTYYTITYRDDDFPYVINYNFDSNDTGDSAIMKLSSIYSYRSYDYD